MSDTDGSRAASPRPWLVHEEACPTVADFMREMAVQAEHTMITDMTLYLIHDGNGKTIASTWGGARARAHAYSIADLGGDDYFGNLVLRAHFAANKARFEFPQPNYVTLKIAEEAGEVIRVAVHYAEGRMEWAEVEGEIVQLLAMLIRFVTEGDEVNGVRPPTTEGADHG